MQKMTDHAIPKGFSFYHWLACSTTRVHWFSWILLFLALMSAADAVSDYLSGKAVVEFGKSATVWERAKEESVFTAAIAFEAIQTVILLLLSWVFHAASRSVSHHDIFAPGQKLKSLEDDKQP